MTKPTETQDQRSDRKGPPLKRDKNERLSEMRRNPRADWRIEDVISLCEQVGLECRPPNGGSHYVVSSPYAYGALTVPRARPIKPIYIKRLVGLVDTHLKGAEANSPKDSPSDPQIKGKRAER